MLLDQIGSLLRSQEGASQSWEATQINELLVQMEGHPGILMDCTNFREWPDSAAVRCFDVKIGFDHLSPEAAWAFFQKVLRSNKVKLGQERLSMESHVAKCRHLTRRGHRAALRAAKLSLLGLIGPGLFAVLEVTNCGKSAHSFRSIGFVADM